MWFLRYSSGMLLKIHLEMSSVGGIADTGKEDALSPRLTGVQIPCSLAKSRAGPIMMRPCHPADPPTPRLTSILLSTLLGPQVPTVPCWGSSFHQADCCYVRIALLLPNGADTCLVTYRQPHYVAQEAGLKLVILLPQLPECWDSSVPW